MKSVLNVGGNSKEIAIPFIYDDYEHVLLDIDPEGNPDILCDARLLTTLEPAQFDAIYCSHNLEHFYHHEVKEVLAGFRYVLKDDGFIHVRVPDVQEVMRIVIESGIDIEDILYDSPSGPIMVLDVFYGFGKKIEDSGEDFYAHKTGFSTKSLNNAIISAGFPYVYISQLNMEIEAVAFANKPTTEHCDIFGLPGPEA